MTTIDGHTFDEGFLSGRWVIDAGCRGFELPQYLDPRHRGYSYRDLNFRMYCLDIEYFNTPDCVSIFKQAALTTHSGQTEAYYFGNGTGNFIKGINEKPGDLPDRPLKIETVPCITLQDIYNEIGTDIDLLKLDIEGAEYAILENLEPIPRQVTVEFHEHTVKDLHNLYIDKIMEHMCKYYHCNLYIREWPQYKYMDCLFIRKDLL